MNPGNLDEYPSQSYLRMVQEGYRQCGVDATQIEQSLAELDSHHNLSYN
jgi:hypothetical protein